MNNPLKYYLEQDSIHKVSLLILIFMSPFAIYPLAKSPTSLDLTYGFFFILLVLTYLIAALSRTSNIPRKPGSLLSSPLLGLTLPLVLAIAATSVCVSQIPFHKGSAFSGNIIPSSLVATSVFYTFFFTVIRTIAFKSKPKNILWLEIRAKGGGPMLSTITNIMYRVGYFQLPWFGEIVFKEVPFDSKEEISFDHIHVGAKVKVTLRGASLSKSSILSVSYTDGVVIYQA
jgi:hypothetical protein